MGAVQLSLEWHVLLACLRTPGQHDASPYLQRPLLERVDWARVTALACRHGIAPLVYHQLHQHADVGTLPQGPMDNLRRAYYGNGARNTLLYAALTRILSALQDIRSANIALKGAALAETVYPHRALRAMSDIDLLVRPEEVARVEARLLAMGYAHQPHPRGTAWRLAEHYHFVFVQTRGAGSGIPLEIHWHLDRPGRPFAIDLEGLWARAVPACIAGVISRVLAPEDLLLYLCLHACKHGLTGSLRPLCDVAATIQRYASTLDWVQLQQRAAHWRVTPYVYLPLQLASDLVGAAVPAACLTALQPEDFEPRLRRWATAVLLEEPGTPPLFPALLRLWQGPRLRDRLAVVRQSLAPAASPHESSRVPGATRRYGSALVRLAALLRRYGPTLWRLCRRDPALTAVAESKVHLAHWLRPFANKRG